MMIDRAEMVKVALWEEIRSEGLEFGTVWQRLPFFFS